MSVTQYIGARYVPLFCGVWDINKEYEPLSIVYYEGNSYTSNQAVPAGTSLDEPAFWALTGNYNAQIEQYRQEVRAYDGRISANADAIAAEQAAREGAIDTERIARENADTALQNAIDYADSAITAEQTARENADTTLQTNIDNANSRIADEETAREDLAEAVKTMHVPITKIWNHAYVSNVSGDDDTADGTQSKPFKTLDAALKRVSESNNNFSIYFMHPGVYALTYSYFTGCVVHFRFTDTCPTGEIKIVCPSEIRGLYFYDAHLNINGDGNHQFVVENAQDLIRCEGSTIWSNYTTFNCNTLSIIGGGMSGGRCIFNCSISSFLADLLFTNSQFQNSIDAPAIDMALGTLRLTGSPGCKFARNANGGSSAVIDAASAKISLNSAVGAQSGVSSLGYKQFFHLDACDIGCTDEWLANLNSLCNEASSLGGLTLRRKASATIPQQ